MVLQNYIDGRFVGAQNGALLQNIAPATGQAFCEFPDSGAADVDKAVSAAKKAMIDWGGLGAKGRSKILGALARGIEKRAEELARAESRDTGKPLWLARQMDIQRAIENMDFYATAILHENSQSHQTQAGVINYTLRQPVGPVACISPWNLPLYLLTWKIAPALAAGNTVVAKPSELAPYTASLLGEICQEVGLPPGVLNIVHGLGEVAGAALAGHPDIKAISFTGGTNTGRSIANVAARSFKKVSLEMGGKNPALVFADADLELAAEHLAKAAFLNQGEICLCGSRILVEAPVYEEFKSIYVPKVRALKTGAPDDPDVALGALISQGHKNKVLQAIDYAKADGGKVLCGGDSPEVEGHEEGYYLNPTLIEGLPLECRTNQEEIFGPVVTLASFEGEAEALRIANGTQYGLAATVWTKDLGKAHRIAEKLEVGVVWVNAWLLRDLRTPFGGIKNSGMGREGGFEALHFFTETKNVCISY